MTSATDSKQTSSSGNKWTKLMDEIRYGQEKQRDPYVKENTMALNRPSFAGDDGQMYSTPEEAAGMNRLRGLTDVSALMDETQNRFESTAIPMITNKMSAAGYGRTPNVGRAIANGWMNAILPVMQEGRNADRGYASMQMGMGARRLGQAGALSPITSSSSSQSSSTGGGFLRSFW